MVTVAPQPELRQRILHYVNGTLVRTLVYGKGKNQRTVTTTIRAGDAIVVHRDGQSYIGLYQGGFEAPYSSLCFLLYEPPDTFFPFDLAEVSQVERLA